MPVVDQLPQGLWDVRDILKGTKLDTGGLQIPGTLNTPDQTFKYSEIVFSPNSALVLRSLRLPFIAIYADDWYFQDRFDIRRDNVNLNGMPGHPAPPTPPTGGGFGVKGNDGGNGFPGTDGQSGFAMPRFVFFARRAFVGIPGRARAATAADMMAVFTFNGIDGGNGGPGGAGGDGTNGTKGEPGEDGDTWFGITDCAGGPGYGGRGGNAGSGGPGGTPGDGGDGGQVYVFVAPGGLLNVFQAINVSVQGGNSGAPGQRGADGKPGQGGPGGDKTDACTANRPGPPGLVTANCHFPEWQRINGAPGSVKMFEYDGFDTELN